MGHDENECEQGGEQMSEAEIDYNVMGSFPASDPPSWTLGVRPRKTCREEFEGEKPSPLTIGHISPTPLSKFWRGVPNVVRRGEG